MVQGNANLPRKEVKKNNRRKKRRTQDISSSSSDSDSSLNCSDEAEHVDLKSTDQTKVVINEDEISDVELVDDDATDRSFLMSVQTKSHLRDVQLTNTDLTNDTGFKLGNIDLKKVASSIDSGNERLLDTGIDRNDLRNKYLGMLFENYGDDMNKLRNAPDFTSKTLVMLANVLKDGSDMFDVNTLKSIVEHK